MKNDEIKKYIVVVLLNDPPMDRLTRVAPAVVAALKSVSTSEPELAFRSENRYVFGYLIKSSRRASAIHTRIVDPGGALNSREPAILLGSERVLVFEIGADFAISRELGRVVTWLQRN